MKIIHTSDWHLGHSLYNYDRSEEQQAFLNQLRDLVAEEKPDALLVCGDVYHTTTPSSATQKMYTDGLLAIHQASPDTRIIITAGNHDSCAKLDIDRSLWQHFNVSVIGGIARHEDRSTDWEKHIIEITDARGETVGYVAAVPHVYPQNFPAEENVAREERQHAFFQSLLDQVKEKNTTLLPVILTAHLAVGEKTEEKPDDRIIGGMDTLPVEELGEGYDYLALGHIHYPHIVKKDYPMIAYCGSPIAVDFDEDYPHSVSVVETSRHGELPTVRYLEIENPRPLSTIPHTPSDVETALKELELLPDDRKDYIRVNLKADRHLTPDIQERILGTLRDKNSRFCYIKINREEINREQHRREMSIEELKQKSPVEIARLYYEEQEGAPMEEELCRLLNETWQSVLRNESDS